MCNLCDCILPILYYDNISPQARSCFMLIKLLNINVDLRQIELINGEHFSEEYKAINPSCTVPTLIHGCLTLYDSHTIMIYLCDKYGIRFPRLCPQKYIPRLHLLNLLFYEGCVLYRRHSHLLTDILLEKYPNIDLQYHKNKIADCYNTLNKLLQNHIFMVGNCITIADLSMVSTIGTLDMMFPIKENIWPNLYCWLQHLKTMHWYVYNTIGIKRQSELLELIGEFPISTGIELTDKVGKSSSFQPDESINLSELNKIREQKQQERIQRVKENQERLRKIREQSYQQEKDQKDWKPRNEFYQKDQQQSLKTPLETKETSRQSRKTKGLPQQPTEERPSMDMEEERQKSRSSDERRESSRFTEEQQKHVTEKQPSREQPMFLEETRQQSRRIEDRGQRPITDAPREQSGYTKDRQQKSQDEWERQQRESIEKPRKYSSQESLKSELRQQRKTEEPLQSQRRTQLERQQQQQLLTEKQPSREQSRASEDTQQQLRALEERRQPSKARDTQRQPSMPRDTQRQPRSTDTRREQSRYTQQKESKEESRKYSSQESLQPEMPQERKTKEPLREELLRDTQERRQQSRARDTQQQPRSSDERREQSKYTVDRQQKSQDEWERQQRESGEEPRKYSSQESLQSEMPQERKTKEPLREELPREMEERRQPSRTREQQPRSTDKGREQLKYTEEEDRKSQASIEREDQEEQSRREKSKAIGEKQRPRRTDRRLNEVKKIESDEEPKDEELVEQKKRQQQSKPTEEWQRKEIESEEEPQSKKEISSEEEQLKEEYDEKEKYDEKQQSQQEEKDKSRFSRRQKRQQDVEEKKQIVEYDRSFINIDQDNCICICPPLKHEIDMSCMELDCCLEKANSREQVINCKIMGEYSCNDMYGFLDINDDDDDEINGNNCPTINLCVYDNSKNKKDVYCVYHLIGEQMIKSVDQDNNNINSINQLKEEDKKSKKKNLENENEKQENEFNENENESAMYIKSPNPKNQQEGNSDNSERYKAGVEPFNYYNELPKEIDYDSDEKKNGCCTCSKKKKNKKTKNKERISIKSKLRAGTSNGSEKSKKKEDNRQRRNSDRKRLRAGSVERRCASASYGYESEMTNILGKQSNSDTIVQIQSSNIENIFSDTTFVLTNQFTNISSIKAKLNANKNDSNMLERSISYINVKESAIIPVIVIPKQIKQCINKKGNNQHQNGCDCEDCLLRSVFRYDSGSQLSVRNQQSFNILGSDISSYDCRSCNSFEYCTYCDYNCNMPDNSKNHICRSKLNLKCNSCYCKNCKKAKKIVRTTNIKEDYCRLVGGGTPLLNGNYLTNNQGSKELDSCYFIIKPNPIIDNDIIWVPEYYLQKTINQNELNSLTTRPNTNINKLNKMKKVLVDRGVNMNIMGSYSDIVPVTKSLINLFKNNSITYKNYSNYPKTDSSSTLNNCNTTTGKYKKRRFPKRVKPQLKSVGTNTISCESYVNYNNNNGKIDMSYLNYPHARGEIGKTLLLGNLKNANNYEQSIDNVSKIQWNTNNVYKDMKDKCLENSKSSIQDDHLVINNFSSTSSTLENLTSSKNYFRRDNTQQNIQELCCAHSLSARKLSKTLVEPTNRDILNNSCSITSEIRRSYKWRDAANRRLIATKHLNNIGLNSSYKIKERENKKKMNAKVQSYKDTSTEISLKDMLQTNDHDELTSNSLLQNIGNKYNYNRKFSNNPSRSRPLHKVPRVSAYKDRR